MTVSYSNLTLAGWSLRTEADVEIVLATALGKVADIVSWAATDFG